MCVTCLWCKVPNNIGHRDASCYFGHDQKTAQLKATALWACVLSWSLLRSLPGVGVDRKSIADQFDTAVYNTLILIYCLLYKHPSGFYNTKLDISAAHMQ